MQIYTYEAEDVLGFVISHDQELLLDIYLEIRKQCALNEAEKPECENKERNKTVKVEYKVLAY
jgi:hypothetical protein